MAPSTDLSAQPVFRMAGVRRGFIAAQPLGVGALLYGVIFGVMASEYGLSLLDGLLMSGFVYSATGQMAALQTWKSAGLVLPLMLAILIINARYLLYSASVQPWLSACATRSQALATLMLLGDSTWVMSMREYQAGYRDAGFLLGSGLAQFTPWMLGTLVGQIFGGILANPHSLGVDFMLPAFAAALLVGSWRGKQDVAAVALAAVCAAALHHLFPGNAWYIVGAGIATGVLAAIRHVD